MSEHDDDVDRDLADFLNRRSTLSQAWRDAVDGQRAPETLDAAILAAAASAPPLPMPKPVSRLRRWRVPIGLAASLLAGIGVLREGLRDDQVREQVLGEQAAYADAERRVMSAAAQRRDAEAAARQAAIPLGPTTQRTPPPAAAMVDAPMPSDAPQVARRPPAAAVPRSESRAERKAEPSVSASAQAMAPRAAVAAETEAAGAAPAPVVPPSSPMADAWQPARYRGLLLGQATVDEVLRRHPLPEVDTATGASEALLPDGRRAHRLLDYGRGLDPRGRVRLYFDAGSEALASVDLVLDPPLALAAVQAMEGLVGEGRPGAAEVAPCPASRTPPGESGEQSVWPQVRSWPAQGVQLLLAGPDRVIELHYLERCW